MSSTIGRTGVNVLSPVRHADSKSDADGGFSSTKPLATHHREGSDTVRFGRSAVLWEDEEGGAKTTIERLPFPTYLASSAEMHAKDDSSVNNDTTTVPSTMHYSRSQDLPTASAYSPSRSSVSPRLSPRRSPRNSPLRQSLNATKELDTFSSSTDTWKSRGTLASDTQDHDYSNSISRSTSVVQEPVTPTSHNTAISTPNSNNEELLAQLEVLKMQNKMLTTRIQRAQEESHTELEKERKQRLVVVTELTTQNQLLSAQLNDAQLLAQRQLQIEKEEFLRLMKQMQVEKDQMDQRVRQAEVLAEDEQRLVRMQKAQLQDAMAQLESERDALARKLETNAVLVKELHISQISVGSSKKSHKHSGSDGNKSLIGPAGTETALMPFPSIFKFAPPCDDQLAGLQKEMSRLASSLKNIDLKKLALGEALQDTENTAAINNLQLSQQLRDEKERLELRVQKMCAEQQQMSLRLAQAEETVRTQNELAAQQLAREQREAEDALAAMSVQQQELIQNLSGSKSPSFSLNDGTVPVVEHRGAATMASASDGKSTGATEQTDADRQLAQMAAAMEELRAQLLQKEQQAHERELALQEQSRLEKEELKKAVQKMKDDLRAERMLQELQYMKDSQIDVNRSHNVMGNAAYDTSDLATGSLVAAAGDLSHDTAASAAVSATAAAVEQNLNFSSTTPIKFPSISSERSSPSFLVGTASGATRSRTGSVCSHNGSRLQLKPPAGSPSASPAHLASHKSLFDLLVADNKANNKANNNNKHKPPSKASSEGRKRDILQFNTHAVNEPQVGALQYQHESSYHKIHLTKKSMLDVTNATNADQTVGTGGGNTKGVKLDGAGKQKTIMDLDSDSDEEPWGAEPATPVIVTKITEKTKDTKKAFGATKIREKKGAAAKSTAKEVLRTSGPEEAAVTPAEKVNPFKSPSRTATTSAPATSVAAAPSVPQITAGSGDIYTDYSNYDLERVAGLPAPHSAAAMNDVPRLQAFARKQLSLLQSLDQAQRQPIFYAAAYGRVEAVQYLLQTLPDAGLGVQFGLQWVRGDMHGDTPLHAAASSGCAQSTELLLEALAATPCVQVDVGVQSIADLQNNLRMTPAHLASSAECLDVLYRYKADIEALDCHQRTPLFIACAMNRESCAEYLIDCLDHAEYNVTGNTQHVSAEDKLLRKDRRGDTPLHAAACNGAIECLLLLLQHGIDPRLKNLTGLKAIDLAVRNRHKKCKDILAEYHLHYCTSSEFDSVLFLATLQGHRKIAEQAQRMNPHADHSLATASANTSTSPEEEYRIIQENPMEAGEHNADRRPSTHNPFAVSPTSSAIDLSSGLSSGPQTAMSNATDQGRRFFPTDGIASVAGTGSATATVGASTAMSETTKALHRATQSMFSLRANKSMRLQRFGAWIAYHDTQSASVFWYNHETSEGQWEEPAQVTTLKQQQASSAKKDIFDKTLQAKMSMRLKRFGDWIEYTTESGKTFYYNDKDGSFQWEHPLGPEHTPQANRTPTAGARNKHRDELRIIDDPAADVEGVAGVATHPAGGVEYTSDSHYPWKAYLDPECGSVFWYNELTHVSQWEMPEEFTAEGESAQYSNSAAYYTAGAGQTQHSQKAQRKGRARESPDLSVSDDHYVIDAQQQQQQQQQQQVQPGGRRSRLRSSSFDDEHDTHAVAVMDHENDLGI